MSAQNSAEKTTSAEDGIDSDTTPTLLSWTSSAGSLAKVSVPTALSLLIQIFAELIVAYFIGNLNSPKMLAGLGLANMLLNIFGMAIGQGMNSAIETLVSQAYGFRDYRSCGLHLNRA